MPPCFSRRMKGPTRPGTERLSSLPRARHPLCARCHCGRLLPRNTPSWLGWKRHGRSTTPAWGKRGSGRDSCASPKPSNRLGPSPRTTLSASGSFERPDSSTPSRTTPCRHTPSHWGTRGSANIWTAPPSKSWRAAQHAIENQHASGRPLPSSFGQPPGVDPSQSVSPTPGRPANAKVRDAVATRQRRARARRRRR
jgi:hypothetical protein